MCRLRSCWNRKSFINTSGESDNQIHSFDNYRFREEPARPKLSVPVVTLDSYCAEHNISPSFIKIDTQGHEIYVLRGSRELIKASASINILCEFAPYLKAWEEFTIDDFFELIKSLDLKVYDINYSLDVEVGVDFLKENYGMDKVGKYTDLLLMKQGCADLQLSGE